MLGIIYNDVMRENVSPTYPTWVQRIVAYIKSLFKIKAPNSLNVVALVGEGSGKVVTALSALGEAELAPTIERRRVSTGWYVEVTPKNNFLKVATGQSVQYYPLRVDPYSLYDNPFYNVEKIISVTGERDDIHKKVKRKDASAEAA